MSVNVCSISGNLGADPELRRTAGGTSILRLSVAVNERVRDASGGWESRANWISCVVFGRRAEALAQRLAKGARVAVSGRLHESRWMQDDQRRSRVELIVDELEFLSPGRDMGDGVARPHPPAPEPAGEAVADEDIPF